MFSNYMDGKLITKNSEIAKVFNNFFANMTKNLGISTPESSLLPTNNRLDPIDIAVKKFQSHPSICKIKEITTFAINLNLKVTIADVVIQIRKLVSNKASPINSIPAKILKESSGIFYAIIQNLYNSGLSKNTIPDELKTGDISSLFKTMPFQKRTIHQSQFCHLDKKFRKD